jgi:predicted  nucleic acid-binding Zn-ribbon protein
MNKELKIKQLEQELEIWYQSLLNCEDKIKRIRDELRELRWGKLLKRNL